MHPPVVRGAIMVSLFLAAEIFGRQRSAFTALTFAAAIMLGISPYVLGNAAFQLSFLAMAGLVFIFPFFRRLGRKAVDISLGDDGVLASAAKITTDSLSATLAAIITVWPVVAYYFGIIAFVGPLATLLTLPALPGIILTGAITGGLGLIALPIAQVFGWLTWFFLTYTLFIVNGLAASSLSSIELSSFNTTLIWVYYPVLAIVIFLNQKKSVIVIPEISSKLKSHLGKSFEITLQRSKKWIILPLLLIAILVSLAAVTMPDDKIHVTFLDVSQGDAILIQKGNQQVLIDGGPSPQATRLELGNRMPFWDRTIDLIVLTHPHHDHLVGLVEVLRYFHVKQVLYPDILWESPTYEEFLILLKEKNVELTIARTGQQINLGDSIVLNVLNPSSTHTADTESDVDNNSIVLRLITGKVSFLLTADISQETEFKLISNRTNLDSTVLKVAHHGSDTSTTLDFIAVVEPQIAVISCGANNKFGHPSEAVLERLEDKLGSENIYRTDQHGNIEFITNGEKLWVKMRNRLD
jgi:competence protein ComEC